MLGSLAYAHPAAEWPAVAVALGAELVLAGRDGHRTVNARDFFRGPSVTDRRAGELLTEVRLPVLPPGTRVGFAEHRRTHASLAQLAAGEPSTSEAEPAGHRRRPLLGG
jgi:carbon-monoxide dehydrogenase medium subunit